MRPRLLSYTSVRAAAAIRRTATVPPLAIVVKVLPAVDTASPNTLLEPCVIVAALTHPILDRLLREAGATTDGSTYQLHAPKTKAPGPALTHALAAAHPACWRAPGTHRLQHVQELLGPALVEALDRAGAAPTTGRPRRLNALSLRLTRAGSRLRVTPAADDLVLAGHTLHAGARHQLRLTPTQALALIGAAQDTGRVVLAADPAAIDAIDALHELAARSCIVVPAPAAPGWAQLLGGEHLDLTTTGPVRADQATALADDLAATGTPVAVHRTVQQVSAATRAATGPVRGTPGLHPWQDSFVAAYLASGPGLVNALPPGAGKTVCAAAAMTERATDADYRAIVLAPATLRSQWAGELARFFPAGDVTVAETATDLSDHAATWSDDHPRPRVIVCTPQLLARTPAAQHLDSHDLVVDEATFLANPHTRAAAAAWTLRRRARHTMVLTGTPEHRGGHGTGELLAFARNTPDEFAVLGYDDVHPDVPEDRAGVLLFTGPGDVSGRLPNATPEPVSLIGGDAEQFIEKLARERVAALLEQPRPSAVALRGEVAAWRLGLASPGALLASGYPLAGRASAAGVPGEAGVKERWVTERARAEVAGGGQVLVFSDFAAALTRLSGHLADAGLRAGVVSSALTTRDRGRLVADFARGDLHVLLVASTGHLGLNLQSAGCVLHLDVPTSASALRQRTARAARLGSTHTTVSVQVPMLTGSADQVLWDGLGEAAASPVDAARDLCRPVGQSWATLPDN